MPLVTGKTSQPMPLVTRSSSLASHWPLFSSCTHIVIPLRKEPHKQLDVILQGTRAALASEEPRVDRLQTQLKELVIFPDLQSLSDSVVAAIQEYQRYPGRLKPGRSTVWRVGGTQVRDTWHPVCGRWACCLGMASIYSM